ncbi:hypothetical protein COY90_00235 [Candidatus Roizmanbacteria bacterium CG_4_10_14_0_8_um_filter_39_9]|uniref:Uncharacterized protein n=1 Tax=Candidatus Roizmanbacteria bacterium CG_4_10_14_0_8_um_filter_39_9 TaxID=1974829 RepID=A0A2M7QFI5_9BACT|nr:MAG: hypothetical protein COY90_00235 [Candidatus Roizmanbacteria bacterium CG_4_10_14_0_8_um_filter_39_9]
MTEATISPEVQQMLPEAVREVTGLYMGDQLNNFLLRDQSLQEREQFWKETANEFLPFADKIIDLWEVVTDAETTKKGYPDFVGVHFFKAGDKEAESLLTDVLFARTIKSPGYMDYGMNVVKEAEVMVRELGVQDGLGGAQIKEITLDKTVESVLTGSLKLIRQTQLEKK